MIGETIRKLAVLLFWVLFGILPFALFIGLLFLDFWSFIIGVSLSIALLVVGKRLFEYWTKISLPYSPTIHDIDDILRRALSEQIHYSEWDNFTSIKITENSYLDEIRQHCDQLSEHETIDSAECVNFDEQGKIKLNELIFSTAAKIQEERNTSA